jgi:superfamily II DNA helicase RecQ
LSRIKSMSAILISVYELKIIFSRNSKAIYLNEENHTPETMRNIVEKRYQRIYTSLKRLDGPVFQKLFRDEQWLKSLIAIVVEDAHAVVEQGEVVRSRYRELCILRQHKGHTVPLLVLSPTLPLHLYYHLEETLELKRTAIINIGCDRPNVAMSVTEFQYKEDSYGDIAKHMPELGTIKAGGKSINDPSLNAADRASQILPQS